MAENYQDRFNPKVMVGKALSHNDPAFLLNPNHQAPTMRKAKLTVVRGAQNGQVFLLNAPINLFGRIEGFLLRDVLASRRHMQIYSQGDTFYLEDLQSTNGTFINGQAIKTARQSPRQYS